MRRLLLLFILSASPAFAQGAPEPAQEAGTGATADESPAASGGDLSGVDESIRKVLGFRDPFRIPPIAARKTIARTPLERYPVKDFRLVGVITGPGRF